MKKILSILVIFFLLPSLLLSCSENEPTRRKTVMGQDISYWQEREENNELGLCSSKVGYGGYSTRHTFGKNSYTQKIYELFSQIDAAETEDFDEIAYLDDGGNYYYISLGDGSGNGLPVTKEIGLRFYDDCRYAIPYSDSAMIPGFVYEIRNPEAVREFLKAENAYVSVETAELLKEKTVEFFRTNDSLLKIYEACDDVQITINTAAEGSSESFTPSKDNDISLKDRNIRTCILPYPSGTAAGTDGLFTGRISAWSMDVDASIDMTYTLLQSGEYEITSIRIELP